MRTREYNCWIDAAGKELMRQRPKRHEGPVSISIVASPPQARKRDLDNLLKAALDLLVSHGVIHDDSTDYLKAISISLGNADAGLAITVTARAVEASTHSPELLAALNSGSSRQA